MNTKFEAHKVRRELARSGKVYDFSRLGKNKFGEPAEPAEKIGSLKGLYHEVNNFIMLETSEAAQTRRSIGMGARKKQPKILCLFESVVESGLQVDDYTVINGKQYKVIGVANVQEWNIIADISLEVVEDGTHVSL